MLSSLQSGLSGMQAHQRYLDVIGNNLANASTSGFKSSRISFSDLFSNTLRAASVPTTSLGGINPSQIGTGVRTASVDLAMTQGAVLSTGRPFDLGIQGNGFFILSNGNDNYYTRNGTFGLDGEQNLVDLGTGMRVQSNTLENIEIDSSLSMPPSQTNQVDLSGVLPAKITGPLAEVVTSNIAFQNGTAATLSSTLINPTFALNDGDSMQIQVNNGAPQTILFETADFVNINAATAAEVITVINDELTGAAASLGAGGEIVITTENTGENATVQILDGTGSPASTIFGFPLSISAGTEDVADEDTLLNDLVANKANYADGDVIILTGTDENGLNVQVNFEYGAVASGYDGTTLGELRDFVTTNIAGATCTIDDVGNLVLTADTEGEMDLSLFLQDGAGITGNTLWPNFSVTTDGAAPDEVTTSVSVFDSQGLNHTLVLTFSRADNLEWDLTAATEDGDPIINNVGSVVFQNDGSFARISGTENSIIIDQGTYQQTIFFDFGSTGQFDGLTQVGSSGFIQVQSQDGYAAGQLATLSVEPDGTVLGHYSNGEYQTMAQLGLAMFHNANGLEKRGDSLFSASPNSGDAVMYTPGTASAGTIVAGALEQSNVDIGEEFVNLIEAQRGFQANARIISTADEILAEMVNLIR